MTVTPIRENIKPLDPTKQQILDEVAICLEHLMDTGEKPAAMLITLVGDEGQTVTRWLVFEEFSHLTSLYLSRAAMKSYSAVGSQS